MLASKILKPIKYTTKLNPISHAAFRLPNKENCAAVVKPMPSKNTGLSLLRVSPMMMAGIISTKPITVAGR